MPRRGGRRAEGGSHAGMEALLAALVIGGDDSAVEYNDSMPLLEQLLRHRVSPADSAHQRNAPAGRGNRGSRRNAPAGRGGSTRHRHLEPPPFMAEIAPFKFPSMRLKASVQASWYAMSEAAAEDGTVIQNPLGGGGGDYDHLFLFMDAVVNPRDHTANPPYPLERTTKVEIAFKDYSGNLLEAADFFNLTGVFLPSGYRNALGAEVMGFVPVGVAENLLREISAVEQARSSYLALTLAFDPKQSLKAQLTPQLTDLRAPMGASTPSLMQETYKPFSFPRTGVAVSVQAGRDYKCEVTVLNQIRKYPEGGDLKAEKGVDLPTPNTLPLKFVTSFAVSVKRIDRGPPDQFYLMSPKEIRSMVKVEFPGECWENSRGKTRGEYVPLAAVEAFLQSLAAAETSRAKRA